MLPLILKKQTSQNLCTKTDLRVITPCYLAIFQRGSRHRWPPHDLNDKTEIFCREEEDEGEDVVEVLCLQVLFSPAMQKIIITIINVRQKNEHTGCRFRRLRDYLGVGGSGVMLEQCWGRFSLLVQSVCVCGGGGG
ncbi:UNVERIFIED_CONTAM: hypothetical protein K2H54_010141 [Gekko kuhli]